MPKTKTTSESSNMWADHVKLISKVRQEHRERLAENYRQMRDGMQDRMMQRLDASAERLQKHNVNVQNSEHHDFVKRSTQLAQTLHQHGIDRMKSNIELTRNVQSSWKGMTRAMAMSFLGFAALSGVKAAELQANDASQPSGSMSTEAVKAPQRGKFNLTQGAQKTRQGEGFNLKAKVSEPAKKGFKLPSK